MNTANFEQVKLFNYEFERLATGLHLLRNKIPEFQFLDGKLIKVNDDTFDNINRKNNELLKEYIRYDENRLARIKEELINVYKKDLSFVTVEKYLINAEGTQSEFSKKFIYHQIVSLILEADAYFTNKDITSLSGNYIYIFQKCFYDKNKYPEEFGGNY